MKLFFWLLIPIWYWVSLPFRKTETKMKKKNISIIQWPSHKYNLLSTFGIIICVQFYDFFSTIVRSSCLAHAVFFCYVCVCYALKKLARTLWHKLLAKPEAKPQLSSNRHSYLPFLTRENGAVNGFGSSQYLEIYYILLLLWLWWWWLFMNVIVGEKIFSDVMCKLLSSSLNINRIHFFLATHTFMKIS